MVFILLSRLWQARVDDTTTVWFPTLCSRAQTIQTISNFDDAAALTQDSAHLVKSGEMAWASHLNAIHDVPSRYALRNDFGKFSPYAGEIEVENLYKNRYEAYRGGGFRFF